MQVVEDHLLGHSFHLLHLAEDDVALALDRGLVELGILENVREDVYRGRDVAREHASVVAGLLPRGVRVQVAPHVLDLLLELPRVARGRAFKGHVLQKVGGAVGGVGLVAGPCVDPDAHGGGLGVRGGLGGDAEAVGEGGDLWEFIGEEVFLFRGRG